MPKPRFRKQKVFELEGVVKDNTSWIQHRDNLFHYMHVDMRDKGWLRVFGSEREELFHDYETGHVKFKIYLTGRYVGDRIARQADGLGEDFIVWRTPQSKSKRYSERLELQ